MVQASFGDVNFNTWGDIRLDRDRDESNPNRVFDFDPDRVFDPNQNTYVITHGFTNSGGNQDTNAAPEQWMSDKAQALREFDPNANIIVTDWADGAQNLNYFQAAEDTREAGELLAAELVRLGADPNKTELIGHSLGAHVSGAAGAKYIELTKNDRNPTGNQLNQITGLDPAGPDFENGQIVGKRFEIPIVEISIEVPVLGPVDPEERLDPSDANRVAVIHTSETFGYNDPIGDFDVYLNRDNQLQPGKFTFLGNHSYAHEVHTDLINGTAFPQPDGSNLDLNRLNSPETSPETGVVNADTNSFLFAGSTSGVFADGSNRLSLGTPAFASFVEFNGTSFSTASDILFSLGGLTYRNGVTNAGSAPTGAIPLNITLSLTNPVDSTQEFNYSFNNVVTPNSTGDPVLDGDLLIFSGGGLSRERFELASREYTLDLIGFSSDGGQTTVGQFNSPENSTANATLFGQVVPVTIVRRFFEEPLDDLGNRFEELITDWKTTVANATNGFLNNEIFRLLFPSPMSMMRINALALTEESTEEEERAIFQITEEIMAENPGGVYGSEENEQIIGSPITDVVYAGGGSDIVEGGMGNDYLRGGTGHDRITGDEGNDILNGNEDDDFVSGGSGDDLVRGGEGDDEISGDDGNDILINDGGSDRMTGGSGTDIFILRTDTGLVETDPTEAGWILDFNPSEGDIIGISAGVSPDILTLTTEDVNQDSIDDTIIQYTETSEIFGVYTNIFGVAINTSPEIVQDALFSIPIGDPIVELGGHSDLNPGGELRPSADATDEISFSDITYQVNENESIAAITLRRTGDTGRASTVQVQLTDGTATGGTPLGNGVDFDNTTQTIEFEVGESSATVIIPINSDRLIEGSEDLTLTLLNPSNGTNIGIEDTATLEILENEGDGPPTPTLNNTIVGTPGDDTLVGTVDNDAILAFAGNDSLNGVSGDNIFIAGPGDDTLTGGIGNETLYGGSGDDLIYGRAGDDILVGDSGRDILLGGQGSDTFVLPTEGVTDRAFADVLVDFSVGQDRIGLMGGLSENDLIMLEARGTNTMIKLAESDEILGIVSKVMPEELEGSFVPINIDLF